MKTTEIRLASPPAAMWPIAVVAAGIAGGVVDAVYFSSAALIDDRSPFKVLQAIASFWMGQASMDGGVASELLGLATHFGLATLMAAGYAAAAAKLQPLRHRPLFTGPIYGLILYGVMYYIVLPLRWPDLYPRINGWRSVADVLAHVGVGLAIAVVFARTLKRSAGTDVSGGCHQFHP